MAKVNYTGGQILSDATPGLKKKHFSVIAMTFFIYCACAGGAFGIESMISASGPGLTILLLVAIPILWALPIGLYSSELTNLAPVQSGPYVWPKMAFGEFWGFSFGWWVALAMYLTGSAYVVMAVDYLSMFFEISPTVAFMLKALIIIIVVVLNLIGLEEVSVVSTIITALVLVAFAAVTIVGFSNWSQSPVEPFMAADAVSSWGVGIAIGVWMYCGYIAVSFIGGEVENPRVIPKGMKVGILIISLSYILPTIAGIVSVGPWTEWGTTVDYSSVLTEHIGTSAGMAFMVIAIIAQFGIFNASVTAGSRSFMVLGQDNLCPKALSTLSKNRKVPIVPIFLAGVVNLILVNLNFEVLVIILSPLLFVIYVGLGFAFYKIRKDYPVEKRGDLYYAKGKLTPIYICGGPLIVGAISFVVNGTEYFLLGFVGILSALVFYPIVKIAYGGLYKNDPVNHPINPKTKLAKGDIFRIGGFLILFGAIATVGSFFLAWYEGSWGPDYYKEVYGSGLISDFWLMISVARYSGIAMLVAGVLFRVIGKKVDPIEG